MLISWILDHGADSTVKGFFGADLSEWHAMTWLARRSLPVLVAALAVAAALPLRAAPAETDPHAKLAAEQKQSYESFRARCEALINDRNYASRESAHYIVETDDPRFDPKAAADLLESYRTWFESFWSGRLALRPNGEKSFVFFFYSYYKYKQLL